MRLLVTPGGGYIGSVLVPEILDRGHQVRVVDRFFFGRDTLKEHPGLEVSISDVRHLQPDDFSVWMQPSTWRRSRATLPENLLPTRPGRSIIGPG